MLLRSIVFLLVLSTAGVALGQEGTASQTRPKAIHVDEFGRVSTEQLRAQFDRFFADLSNNPQMQGYAFLYNGVDQLPAQLDSYGYERALSNHINFRGFDRSRITIVRGGFREQIGAEFYMIPPGAEDPVPSRTVAPPKIPKRKTLLFDRRYADLEEYNFFLDQYELQSVRDYRIASIKKQREEIDGEMTPTSPAEATSAAEIEDVENDRLYFEENKFDWVSTSFGEFLKSRKGSRGVIVFYADDQRFDIGKLHLLIEEGKTMLANDAGISPSAIRVDFGGYRHAIETEFWFVPPKGTPPPVTPELRPAEGPDETN